MSGVSGQSNARKRARISKEVREEVFRRDEQICQFCSTRCALEDLSIDHLIPFSLGGPDDITNFVTACRDCNQRKSNTPLPQFAATIGILVEDLPVHGDRWIDDERLPIEVRLLRKRIIDKMRNGELSKRKLEKVFRQAFWSTPRGKALEMEFPLLPSHVRIAIPKIQTLADSEDDFSLLIELAKSELTRQLIDGFVPGQDFLETVLRLRDQTKDDSLKQRLEWALKRYKRSRNGE